MLQRGNLIEMSDTQQRMRKPIRRLEEAHNPTAPAQISADEKLSTGFYAIVDWPINEVWRRCK